MTYTLYPELAGTHAFISGGATGIGEGLVRGFAANGARTSFVDIDTAAGEALAAELTDAGQTAHFIHCDITDTARYQAAITGAAEQFGPITTLANNAANDVRHKLEDLTPERFDELIAVNLKHFVFATQTVTPMMQQAGHGSIINFSSISWMRANGGFPAYAASKSAMLGLTRSMARNLGPDRIRVNNLTPGWVMTEKQVRLWLDEEGRQNIARNQMLEGPLLPLHIANMALFLASDGSAMCTAQNFIVDGGWV